MVAFESWLAEAALSLGASPHPDESARALWSALLACPGARAIVPAAPPGSAAPPSASPVAGAAEAPVPAGAEGAAVPLSLGAAGEAVLLFDAEPPAAVRAGLLRLAGAAANALRPPPPAARTTETPDSDRFLESVIENIPDMVFVKEATDLRFVRFNRAGERLLGWQREALLGRSDHDFFPPDEAEFFVAKDREVLASGELVDIPEEPIHTAAGTRYLHTKKIPIHDAQGRPTYLLGISEDITEKKRAAEALRLQERRYQNLFQSAPAALWEMDASGARAELDALRNAGASLTVRLRRIFGQLRTLAVNDAALRLFGTPDAATFDRNLADFLAAGRHGHTVVECLVELLLGQPVVEREVAVRRLDGTPVHVLMRVAAPGEPSDLGYVLVAMTDITALKEAEEAVSRAALELRRSNADLQQFAYVASHDLQEPLRIIAGFSELLRKGQADRLTDEGREFLEYILDGTARMQRLIRDLLAYARVDSRTGRTSAVSLDEPLDAALVNLRASIEEAGARIDRGSEPLPTAVCDAIQMAQVFQNLIGNALKFRSAASPEVRIRGVVRGDRVEISIADNGIGFDAQYTERIFEIFQRLHGPTAYPGTGIGLALCKKIVERHGGSIAAEGHPGAGATFRFTVPLRAPR